MLLCGVMLLTYDALARQRGKGEGRTLIGNDNRTPSRFLFIIEPRLLGRTSLISPI
jgi:hypothetical protein